MQDHHGLILALQCRPWVSLSLQITSRLGSINAIVTPVQGCHHLAEDSPNKFFLCKVSRLLQLFDDCAKVTSTTIFHVDVELLGLLQMFSMEVLNDVGMAERREDRKLGMQLFSLFRGHLQVIDLFATQNLRLVNIYALVEYSVRKQTWPSDFR